MDIDWIKKKISEGDYEFSAHADEERQADKLMIHEIERVLLKGEILEDYSDDPRGGKLSRVRIWRNRSSNPYSVWEDKIGDIESCYSLYSCNTKMDR